MSELYPSDADLNALSGAGDDEQDVLYVPIGESPYYTSFYKMLYRLLDVARRAGDLRVYKDGELTFGVRAGRFVHGDSSVDYAGTTGQSLTNNATNYIYLTADGTLVVNTTGFPVPSVTAHIPLATIKTGSESQAGESGSYAHADITDYRGRAIFQLCGASQANLLGLDWQASVLDRDLSEPPANPTAGDRYIVAAGGAGDWSGLDGRIVQYNGASWTEIAPNEGFLTLVEDEDLLVGYNGAAWVDLGTLANLRDLTDGGNADALHTHGAAGIEDGQLPRAKLAEESLASYPIALMQCRNEDGSVIKDDSGWPIGSFGVVAGGWDDGTLYLRSSYAVGTTRSCFLCFELCLPPEYVDGGDVRLRIHTRYDGEGTVAAHHVDARVYAMSDDGTPGGDLNQTNQQDVTTSWADYTFTINSGSLAPGDRLLVLVKGEIGETSGEAGLWMEIGSMEMQLDIAG